MDIEIIDYDDDQYRVIVAFDTDFTYISFNLSLSDLAVLSEIMRNAKAELEERIAKQAGNQSTRQ